MSNEGKYCVNCKHSRTIFSTTRCFNKKNIEANLVTGKEMFLFDCEELRSKDIHCGTSGKWFEQRTEPEENIENPIPQPSPMRANETIAHINIRSFFQKAFHFHRKDK